MSPTDDTSVANRIKHVAMRERIKQLNFQTLAPSLAVLGLFLVTFSIVAWVLTQRFANLQHELSSSTAATRSLLEMARLRSASKEHLLLYRLTSNTQYLGEMNDYELEKSLHVNRLLNEVTTIAPKERLLEPFLGGLRETRNIRLQILDAVSDHDQVRATRLFESYSTLYDINSARLADVHAKVHGRLTRAENEMRLLLQALPILLVFMILGAATVSVLMIRFYRRRVLEPLSLLHEGLGAVSDGRFGRKIEIPPTASEIQEMLEDFNAMTFRLRKMTSDLTETREEAMRAASAKSEFLSNMSHEIRTPLNVIIGLADLMTERPLDRETRHELQILRRSGQLLLGVVNDILDYSRLESGNVTMNNEPFDVRESITGIRDMIAPLAKSKGLELGLSISPDVPSRIMGDSQLFGQALLNLVNNAVKFTEHGNVTISARVSRSNSGAMLLQVSVIDTGVGIASDKLERLFNRFAQADSSITRKFGGSGLGLAIVKQITSLFKGDIEVSSSDGHGSTFTLRIPIEAVAKVQPLISSSGSGTGTGAQTQLKLEKPWIRAPKVLLADDSSDNRFLVKRYLAGIDAEIVEARHGREAVEAFEASSFDIILMDIQMPEMDGYQATREIRRMENAARKHRTPIIALTAFALKEEAERSLANGCDAHMAKPICKTELIDSIQHFVNENDARKFLLKSIEIVSAQI